MVLSDDALPRKRDDLTLTELDGELVILDEVNNKVHQLNPSGTLIFKSCDGKTQVAQMQDLLMEHFDVDKETASNDVSTLLSTLHDNQLLI